MLVFTDGSFSKKPTMAGLGAVIICDGKEHIIGCYRKDCSDNNIAEVAAIAMALQYINDCKFEQNYPNEKTITIISDSQYALMRIKNDSEGRTEEEKKYLAYIKEFMATSKKKINLMQVKGHTNQRDKLSFYNNMADRTAGEYRQVGLELEKTRQDRYRRNKKYSR